MVLPGIWPEFQPEEESANGIFSHGFDENDVRRAFVRKGNGWTCLVHFTDCSLSQIVWPEVTVIWPEIVYAMVGLMTFISASIIALCIYLEPLNVSHQKIMEGYRDVGDKSMLVTLCSWHYVDDIMLVRIFGWWWRKKDDQHHKTPKYDFGDRFCHPQPSPTSV